VAKSDERVMEEFDEAVNMSARELEEWLQTEESQEVGSGESHFPRLTVLGAGSHRYVSWHRLNLRDLEWHAGSSHILMNWGHDPLK